VVAKDKAAADRLLKSLNAGILKKANKRLDELANRWEVSPSEPNEVVLYDDANVRIIGNTNGSHGYLYVTAQLKEIA
jgi:hypothetical protein